MSVQACEHGYFPLINNAKVGYYIISLLNCFCYDNRCYLIKAIVVILRKSMTSKLGSKRLYISNICRDMLSDFMWLTFMAKVLLLVCTDFIITKYIATQVQWLPVFHIFPVFQVFRYVTCCSNTEGQRQ